MVRGHLSLELIMIDKPVLKEETFEEMRAKFPEKLVLSFVIMNASDYADKEYAKYLVCAKDFLKNKFNDTIEQCKLIVKLTKSTFDLVKKDGKKAKEKEGQKNIPRLECG